MQSGRKQGLPYSFSRWTDVPMAKWDWMLRQFEQGSFMGFDPRSPLPSKWSLNPAETLGLIFWTKDPTRLLDSKIPEMGYQIKLNHTITGWGPAMEPNAPDLGRSLRALGRATRLLGPSNVRWRCSPIPTISNFLPVFRTMACGACGAGLTEVYCSFLQDNIRVPEHRSPREKEELLDQMGEVADHFGIGLVLCQEESTAPWTRRNVRKGICAPPEDFGHTGPREACGCGLAIDPFTRNEACSVGCRYCYTVDLSAGTPRNTTRHHLPVVG